MEYLITPVVLMLLLRYGFPALITWFFETVLEPRPEAADTEDAAQVALPPEPSNAQKMEATRLGLDQLKSRLQEM